MNFALSKEQFDDPQAQDINNEAFWQKLHEVFQVTLEMVKETAQEQGIDLDCLDLKLAVQEHEKTRNIAENNECCRAAKAYGKTVQDWFDSSKDLFEEKADDFSLQARLELPNSDPAKEAADLKDAVDVIRWYQHFIYVKLLRAVGGSMEEASQSLDEFPKDSDGSAKIALIAIERSIAAWGQMCKYFPQRKDNVLDILMHLDRLRRKTESLFPDARTFIRPGFDD